MTQEAENLAQLGKDFITWVMVQPEGFEKDRPSDKQVNDLAVFGVRLISLIKAIK